MVNCQWYYLCDGASRGPVSRLTLNQLVAVGQITPQSLVWHEGMTDWRSAASLGLTGPRAATLPPDLPTRRPASVEPPPIAARPSGRIAEPPCLPARSVVIQENAITTPRWNPLIVGGAILGLLLAVSLGWLAHAMSSGPVAAPASSPKSLAQRDDEPAADPTVSTRRLEPREPPRAFHPEVKSAEDENDGKLAKRPPIATPEPAIETAAEVRTPASEVPEAPPPPPPTAPPLTTITKPDSASITSTFEGLVKQPTTKEAVTPIQQPKSTSDQATTPTILFQELDIERAPKFAVLGTVVAQDLRYQILSELRVSPWSEQETRVVEQVIQDTRLVRSDDLSRATFVESLRALRGWQFSFQVNRRGEVSEWKAGPKDGRKAIAVEPMGAKGFLMTSVMDADGWKELSGLSFFVPPEQVKGNATWNRPMKHDYGPLGSWYGETRFKKGKVQSGVLRVDFVHHLNYAPPGKDAGALPFALKSAVFRPEAAGGAIEYDLQASRVLMAQERFLVKGVIQTELLGQPSTVDMEETQVTTVRMHEQNPWPSSSK